MPIKRSKPASRGHSLYTKLRDLAYKQGPESKLPTVQEICETYGTTRVTLNEALEKLESQNVITRKHGSGIYVSPKLHCKTICIIFDSSHFRAPKHSPFWDMLCGLIMQEAQKRTETKNEEYSFHFGSISGGFNDPLQDNLVKLLKSGSIDAAISIGLQESALEELKNNRIPFVTFAGPGQYQLVLDMEELVRTAADDLLRQGCRRIGMWQSVSRFRPVDVDRGVIKARVRLLSGILEERGLVLAPELVKDHRHLLGVADPEEIGTHQAQGYRIGMREFSDLKNSKMDGVIIADDMMTHGALAALHKLEMRVGRDIKIATHANKGSTVLFGFEEYLSLIEFDPEEIVTTLFSMLEVVLSGRKPPKQKVAVQARLRHNPSQ